MDAGAGNGADAILECSDSLLGEPGLGNPSISRMVRFIHVNEGADGMWAAARQGTRHIVRRPWYESVRAIADVEQIVLPDDLGDSCLLGHHPERIEAFGFDPSHRSLRPQPTKP